MVQVDGLYKSIKLDNVADYMKNLGFPEHTIAGMDTFKIDFRVC